ncbi:zinc finger BED domain-containing protein 4-like isoform X2 [Salarias fasciatus]|uniref:zinc finger BED domain-containing protein 4-like isoform X2 n=1 Tax=Salarias fasciatus TaxID=181472 RepID=UPI001176F9A1|nr:zinc finger BED domain-containing protein 4-like isoform X2 [Salarias fasciatus]
MSQLQKSTDEGGEPSVKKAKILHQDIAKALLSTVKYKSDAKEQQIKEDAIAKWIGRTGLPVTTVEDEDFILMIETFDKKLTVPKKTKISNLIEKQYDTEVTKFKKRLSGARKVSIGIDLWTKKGLTASFLAISCCYFCVEQNRPEHKLLALEQVAHPHTAQSIKACVHKCIQEWGISSEKILTVITDNGSNMVAAFKQSTQEEEETSSDDPDEFHLGENESEEETEDVRYQNMDMDMERMPCVVHTLQLVVQMINKEPSAKRLLDKARSIVKLFRKSSVATQRILDECGLIVVNDCPTRWSSTFNMIERLLKVKESLCKVANEMGWDSLLSSEWQKLKSLHELLLLFAEHTQTLQSDTMSMSLIVPAVLDLVSHLADFEQNTNHRDFAALARKAKLNLKQRFAWVLDPTDEKFSPLVAAARFLNPTVCETLLDVAEESIQELLKQAEGYVVQSTQTHEDNRDDDDDNVEEMKGQVRDPTPDPAPESAPSSSSKQPVFRFLSKCRSKPKPKSSTCGIK